MQWYNEPALFEQRNGIYTVTTKPRQDFWRKTLHQFIKDDGHFYYETVAGDFTVDVKFTGKYREQYDQAGLMLRESETVWMKCGIELLDGVQRVSTVVTREFSDWSIIKLDYHPPSCWLRVRRMKEAIEVYYSLNGIDFFMMRQAYLSVAESLQVGLMACSPTGEGFTVTFENFQIGR